ncbi:GNAT family N-acetyltransferase [Hahella sp. HN01]|uniref:GNAT family N-acetyltransferase n=1 Tax=unclassified Hahella TaxID=2624107 RepID=UPI001C1F0A03|nr:GNAT family N-acyltransferase [Hahella sp. HN01]MBU6954913.1 GNAT family N-acetyltransferase [Hahella sp. HN01]
MHTSGQRVVLAKAESKKAELFVRVAQRSEEVIMAQQLRYRIFTEEFGANLHSPVPGLDCDSFDPFCDHLLVKDNISGQVVATTRLLADDKAKLAGSFYSESEFDLSAICQLPGRKLEIGRTCVHPAFRNGATLALLWSGIAKYVIDNEFDYLLGCGSISVIEGTAEAWSITRQLQERCLTAENARVIPKRTLPQPVGPVPNKSAVPPLIRAYMRLGAQIGGDPCWDPDFQCADLFILLHIDALAARYAKHFMKEPQA